MHIPNLLTTMKEHPVPTALLGVGLGWLAYQATRDALEEPATQRDAQLRREAALRQAGLAEYPARYPDRARFAEQRGRGHDSGSRRSAVAERVGSMGDRAASLAAQAKHAASDARHAAGEAASSAGHRISDAASSAGHAVSDAASSARHYASDAASAVMHRSSAAMKRSRHSVAETYDDHPLAIGLTALGVGLLTGLAVPSSRRENEWLGEYRDEFLNEARKRAGEWAETGRAAAEHAVDDAASEAERQRLNLQGAKETAVHAAADVAQGDTSVTEEVREVAQDAKQRAGEVARAAKDAVDDEVNRQRST